MLIHLNYKTGQAAYLQIVDQVKYAAASGAIRPGESLPGIRPLAEQLRINRNTVAKAYSELERQGVIETAAGKGCFISQNSSPYKESVQHSILVEAIDHTIVQAHHFQVPHEKLRSLIEERLQAFQQTQSDHRQSNPSPSKRH